jgi:hypothetical protein
MTHNSKWKWQACRTARTFFWATWKGDLSFVQVAVDSWESPRAFTRARHVSETRVSISHDSSAGWSFWVIWLISLPMSSSIRSLYHVNVELLARYLVHDVGYGVLAIVLNLGREDGLVRARKALSFTCLYFWTILCSLVSPILVRILCHRDRFTCSSPEKRKKVFYILCPRHGHVESCNPRGRSPEG